MVFFFKRVLKSRSRKINKTDDNCDSSGFRTIVPTVQQPKRAKNIIRNQRYTLFNFVFIVILSQFKYFYNIFFFLICFTQFFNIYSVSPLISNISPWVIVLTFTLLKEGMDDYNRYKRDKEANSQVYSVIRMKPFKKSVTRRKNSVLSLDNDNKLSTDKKNFDTKINANLNLEKTDKVTIDHNNNTQRNKQPLKIDNRKINAEKTNKSIIDQDNRNTAPLNSDISKNKTSTTDQNNFIPKSSINPNFSNEKLYNSNDFFLTNIYDIIQVPSSDLKVGDIVFLEKDQRVPADCILLASLEENLFIRTDQLDGETDWKLRVPVIQSSNKENLMFSAVDQNLKNTESYNRDHSNFQNYIKCGSKNNFFSANNTNYNEINENQDCLYDNINQNHNNLNRYDDNINDDIEKKVFNNEKQNRNNKNCYNDNRNRNSINVHENISGNNENIINNTNQTNKIPNDFEKNTFDVNKSAVDLGKNTECSINNDTHNKDENVKNGKNDGDEIIKKKVKKDYIKKDNKHKSLKNNIMRMCCKEDEPVKIPIRCSKEYFSLQKQRILEFKNLNDILSVDNVITADIPHKDIHSFIGTFTSKGSKHPLTLENTLWMNTILSSGHAICCITYTGKETRAVLNTCVPRHKYGLIEDELNLYSKILFGLSFIFSFVFTVMRGLSFSSHATLIKFIVILSSVIPISLRVSVDWARYFYGYIIEKDIPNSKVRNSNIPEELGRISYLLTDKTGTLTRNEMEMKKMHLGNICYSEECINDIREILHERLSEEKSKKNYDLPLIQNENTGTRINYNNLNFLNKQDEEDSNKIIIKKDNYTNCNNRNNLIDLLPQEESKINTDVYNKRSSESNNFTEFTHRTNEVTREESKTNQNIQKSISEEKSIIKNDDFTIHAKSDRNIHNVDLNHTNLLIKNNEKIDDLHNSKIDSSYIDKNQTLFNRFKKNTSKDLLFMHEGININEIDKNNEVKLDENETFYTFLTDKTSNETLQNNEHVTLTGKDSMKSNQKSNEHVYSNDKNLMPSIQKSNKHLTNENSIQKNDGNKNITDKDSMQKSNEHLTNNNLLHKGNEHLTFTDKNSSMKSIQKKKKHGINNKLYDLLVGLSLCHNVTPVHEDGITSYQASSPDEIAIVQWTDKAGIKLIKRTRESMILKDFIGEKTYYILQIFPFTSESKRMGIIIRDPDGNIDLIVKGADTVMRNIVKVNDWLDEETDNMAREGLRTLVIGKKRLSFNEYNTFKIEYNNAATSMKNRKEKMEKVICMLEKNLNILGLTGVEDKLQEDVKETLENLRYAGIKTWMLTGDKVETATCIAISSKLFSKTGRYRTIENIKSREEAFAIVNTFIKPKNRNKKENKNNKKETDSSSSKITQIRYNKSDTYRNNMNFREAYNSSYNNNISFDSDSNEFYLRNESNDFHRYYKEHEIRKNNFYNININNFSSEEDSNKINNFYNRGNEYSDYEYKNIDTNTYHSDTKNEYYNNRKENYYGNKNNNIVINDSDKYNEYHNNRSNNYYGNKNNNIRIDDSEKDPEYYNHKGNSYYDNKINNITIKDNEKNQNKNYYGHKNNNIEIHDSDKNTEYNYSRISSQTRNLNFGSEQAFDYLVIDGTSLQILMDNFKEEFIKYCSRLDAVVCCRCSPTQKSDIALALREVTKLRVACIGDGGNDVSMITSADVGIGIVGKEGKQASLAADFSIEKFKDIHPLFLWHGRNWYKATARLANLIIHRGTIISVMQAIFCCLFEFSPISLYQGSIIVGYVTLYTFLPVFCSIMIQDSTKKVVLNFPELYKELSKSKLLSIKSFALWNVISFYQGALIMLLAFYFFEKELFGITTITFSSLIINELLMVFLVVKKITKHIILSIGTSLFFYILSFFILKEELVIPCGIGEFIGKVLIINVCAIVFSLFEKLYSTYIKPSTSRKLTNSENK